ncbi:hypothetical protein [Actinomadura verrucosospora]|uniref:Uncharacterized protein n=1 Tax=Actinomadura verrucosospora TaxID=46165 RepID=A0A7D3VU25_ACTVE|nr:hypothetical protein [Actinomadura verrucosospora]QKG23275.1 hypothetical protein ACTIVE_4918 [Actinomadura verrucosospora]
MFGTQNLLTPTGTTLAGITTSQPQWTPTGTIPVVNAHQHQWEAQGTNPNGTKHYTCSCGAESDH